MNCILKHIVKIINAESLTEEFKLNVEKFSPVQSFKSINIPTRERRNKIPLPIIPFSSVKYFSKFVINLVLGSAI